MSAARKGASMIDHPQGSPPAANDGSATCVSFHGAVSHLLKGIDESLILRKSLSDIERSGQGLLVEILNQSISKGGNIYTFAGYHLV
jgi:hypothetical protein